MATKKVTGTQFKAQKKIAKAQGKTAELAYKEEKHKVPRAREARSNLVKISKGAHEPKFEKTKYKPEAKFKEAKYNPKAEFKNVKYKPETKYEKESLNDLIKNYERAGKGAEKIYAPIKEQALHEFQTQTLPGITQQLGGTGFKSSSSINRQAAAAGGNLHRGINADFAGIQQQLAENMIARRENSRQFAAQFGNQQEQFGAQHAAQQNQFGAGFRNQQEQFGAQHAASQNQFGANFANQQQQFGAQFAGTQNQNAYQAAAHNLGTRVQTLGALQNQTINPSYAGGLESPYNQHGAGQPSPAASLLGPIAQGAGTAASLWAAAKFLPATVPSSREVKENVRSYDKGLEALDHLEVMQYDYKTDEYGRQTDRVGLIAEDVPEELQAMIGNVRGVDVYGLVSLLVNAVKQLKDKVEKLEAQHV